MDKEAIKEESGKKVWEFLTEKNLSPQDMVKASDLPELLYEFGQKLLIKEQQNEKAFEKCQVCNRNAPLIDGECPDCRH